MKYILFSLAVLSFSACAAQDIIFPDKGYRESFSKLKDKTIRREIATFTDAGSPENIAGLSLKELPLLNYGTDYSAFEKDSVYIKVSTGEFIKARHKIKYAAKYAVKIDNRPIWGTDGELPKKQINSIFVRIGKDTVLIPRTAYQNLFEPGLTWKEKDKVSGMLSVYYSNDRRRYYIAMGNSDGAGFYEATLIIKNKKYYGRVLDTGF